MQQPNVRYANARLSHVARCRLPLAMLAATLFAVISAGAAQAAPAALNAGPVKVHGYQMLMSTSQQAGSLSLQVSLVRTTRSSTQQHTYTFPLKPGTLKTAGNLGSATLKTGQLGGFGSITMRLVHAGKLTKVKTCGVTAQARRGTLSGSLRLVLDKTFFRTVSVKAMPATVSRSGGSGSCQTGQQPTKPAGGSLMLSASTAGPPASTFLVAKGASGPTTVMSTQNEQVGQVRIAHLLIATLSGSVITAASDLSTAHINGEAARPLFGGIADFASAAPALAAGKCTMAFGKLFGTLSAYFDSIGNRSIGGSASLTRC